MNVELLVQDACSDDTTSEVLAAHSDSRVKVFREEDSGPADAINRGLSKAKGDIFGWLNADDELEPGALSKVIRVFEDEPAVELVYGRGFYVDEEGIRMKPYDVRPFDRRLLLTRDFILQPAAFWRRSLWERVGPLDPTLAWGFDWEWFIRASNETSFRFPRDDLARFRLTGENKSLVGGDERHAELGGGCEALRRCTATDLPLLAIRDAEATTSDSPALRIAAVATFPRAHQHLAITRRLAASCRESTGVAFSGMRASVYRVR